MKKLSAIPLLVVLASAILVAVLYQLGYVRIPVASDAIAVAGPVSPAPAPPRPETFGYPDDRRETAGLSIETKLLYSALLGRPYGLAIEDLHFKNLPAKMSATGFGLASAARQALRVQDHGLFNSHKLLIDFLSGAREPHELTDLPPDFPPGLRSDDLAMVHVYALVMSGHADAVVKTLSDFGGSKSDFTRAFCIMALRAIGTPQAREIVKSMASKAEDSMLANDALAFQVPNFLEPKVFAHEVLPMNRFREKMLEQARRRGTKSILPTMLLAFVGPDADAAQIDAELQFLRGLHKTADNALWRKYMYGYATLAFRSREPFEQWLTMYRGDSDSNRRSFILRAMSMQHPDRFHAEMLPVFENEPEGWTQFEFLAIYKGLIEGKVLYGPFDAIWMPPVRYRMAYPAQSDRKKARSSRAFLDLWASGRFPQDKYCSHCRQSWLRDLATPQDEARFVRGYLALSKIDEHAYQDLRDLSDPRLAGVVRYFAERQTDPKVREAVREVHAELVRRLADRGGRCCEPSEACLRQHAALESSHEARFTDDAEVARYLDRLAQNTDIRIEYLDALKRRASVAAAGGKKVLYEHWLGCWRKEGSESQPK